MEQLERSLLIIRALQANVGELEEQLGDEWLEFRTLLVAALQDLAKAEDKQIGLIVNRVVAFLIRTTAAALVRELLKPILAAPGGVANRARRGRTRSSNAGILTDDEFLAATRRKPTDGPDSITSHIGQRDIVIALGDLVKETECNTVDSPKYSEKQFVETNRFTDLTLYRGFCANGEVLGSTRMLEATNALKPHSEYTLEVAIRKEPTGIDSVYTDTPVQNPRKGRENVTAFAVVSCRQPNAPSFKDHMLRLTWPFESDSTSAFFRFETGAALPPEPLKIEIRLYTLAGLQLLDLLELTYASGMWTKIRPDTGPAAIALPPSAMMTSAVSFHITSEPDGFGLEALFLRDDAVQLEAPLGRAILAGDLEALLVRVHNYWTRLVIGKMSTRRALSEHGYADVIADLASLGAAAWRTIFGDRHEAQGGTPEAVGELMRSSPLPPSSPVRVTFASNAENFVFPWAILCPPLKRKEAPDPGSFWGLRYMIELTRKYEPSYRREGGKKVRIVTTVDPGFAGSVDHSATLARIAAADPGAELLDGNSEDDVLDRLESEPSADIYYYFCQGVSPGRVGTVDIDVLAEIEKMLVALSETERKPWQMLLSRIKSDPGVAFMYTGAATITEDKLRSAEFFRESRPIVFLNMCHSAGLFPSMRSGLTNVFIERNAAAVLGTECPVTSIFADMFAERVLTSLLNGQTIGNAVLTARRRFHAERNPLGLLYTLYGHADARVAESPVHQEG